MKHIVTKMSLALLLLTIVVSCTKIDYTEIEQPAYLRVFNNFNYGFSLGDMDKKVPFLTMLINPTFDAQGKLTGAEIIGDFLDIRNPYAPPYPSHIGTSTTVNNPEYPGKEDVLVGPVLNGYDLSSWAQVPSGQLRFMFVYRPKNTVGYFDLEPHLRDDVMLDTTVNLVSSEVYTMHLLQQDYRSQENTVLLRQEGFHKQPLSDDRVYVNFYNYSAKGFWQSADLPKPKKIIMGHFQYGIKDTMDVFLTLYPDQALGLANTVYKNNAIAGYQGKYLTTVYRNTSSDEVAPYHSFPLFADMRGDGISTQSWQSFDFLLPGLSPSRIPFGINDIDTDSNWANLACITNGLQRPSRSMGAALPNMLVNIHSGIHNPRSFATVNTIEVVNGSVYLMTVQRKYPVPQYKK